MKPREKKVETNQVWDDTSGIPIVYRKVDIQFVPLVIIGDWFLLYFLQVASSFHATFVFSVIWKQWMRPRFFSSYISLTLSRCILTPMPIPSKISMIRVKEKATVKIVAVPSFSTKINSDVGSFVWSALS